MASVSLTRTGASRWMAPEILMAEQEDSPVKHSPASDVFSFGMLMLQVGGFSFVLVITLI